MSIKYLHVNFLLNLCTVTWSAVLPFRSKCCYRW